MEVCRLCDVAKVEDRILFVIFIVEGWCGMIAKALLGLPLASLSAVRTGLSVEVLPSLQVRLMRSLMG